MATEFGSFENTPEDGLGVGIPMGIQRRCMKELFPKDIEGREYKFDKEMI